MSHMFMHHNMLL